jgi:hypothetical protein
MSPLCNGTNRCAEKLLANTLMCGLWLGDYVTVLYAHKGQNWVSNDNNVYEEEAVRPRDNIYCAWGFFAMLMQS